MLFADTAASTDSLIVAAGVVSTIITTIGIVLVAMLQRQSNRLGAPNGHGPANEAISHTANLVEESSAVVEALAHSLNDFRAEVATEVKRVHSLLAEDAQSRSDGQQRQIQIQESVLVVQDMAVGSKTALTQVLAWQEAHVAEDTASFADLHSALNPLRKAVDDFRVLIGEPSGDTGSMPLIPYLHESRKAILHDVAVIAEQITAQTPTTEET